MRRGAIAMFVGGQAGLRDCHPPSRESIDSWISDDTGFSKGTHSVEYRNTRLGRKITNCQLA